MFVEEHGAGRCSTDENSRVDRNIPSRQEYTEHSEPPSSNNIGFSAMSESDDLRAQSFCTNANEMST